jgi:hypothetical protein
MALVARLEVDVGSSGIGMALVARFEVVVGFEVDVGGSGIEVALVASFEVEVGGSGPFVLQEPAAVARA